MRLDFTSGTRHGSCKVCGKSGITYKVKGKKKYGIPYYKVFIHEGWFRGDDTYLGKVCQECYKTGRAARELLPNQETEDE